MKIISKYKDYYDYLAGINGIDNLVILDRTSFTPIPKDFILKGAEDTVVTLNICGWVVEVLRKEGKFYSGKSLEDFDIKDYKSPKWDEKDSNDYYHVECNKGQVLSIRKTPYRYICKGCVDVNTLANCPILVEDYDVLGIPKNSFIKVGSKRYGKFPRLLDYGISTVFPPGEIWNMLYNWIIKTKYIPDNQTDKEKIISHGFDIKKSFRHRK